MKFLITYLFLLFCLSFQAQTSFRDSSLPIEERVDLLISQMTIDEKISQLMSDAPAIKSLGNFEDPDKIKPSILSSFLSIDNAIHEPML